MSGTRKLRPRCQKETYADLASGRWKIERMFKDDKGDLGMDYFEVRRFRSMQQGHLILSCVSHLFPAELHQAHRGENPLLALCHARTARRYLAPIGARGGRCSRTFAERISRQIVRTQQSNVKSRRRHRKRTLGRLHARGLYLKDLRMCQWKSLWRCGSSCVA